jgi:hypothetical protein
LYGRESKRRYIYANDCFSFAASNSLHPLVCFPHFSSLTALAQHATSGKPPGGAVQGHTDGTQLSSCSNSQLHVFVPAVYHSLLLHIPRFHLALDVVPYSQMPLPSVSTTDVVQVKQSLPSCQLNSFPFPCSSCSTATGIPVPASRRRVPHTAVPDTPIHRANRGCPAPSVFLLVCLSRASDGIPVVPSSLRHTSSTFLASYVALGHFMTNRLTGEERHLFSAPYTKTNCRERTRSMRGK